MNAHVHHNPPHAAAHSHSGVPDARPVSLLHPPQAPPNAPPKPRLDAQRRVQWVQYSVWLTRPRRGATANRHRVRQLLRYSGVPRDLHSTPIQVRQHDGRLRWDFWLYPEFASPRMRDGSGRDRAWGCPYLVHRRRAPAARTPTWANPPMSVVSLNVGRLASEPTTAASISSLVARTSCGILCLQETMMTGAHPHRFLRIGDFDAVHSPLLHDVRFARGVSLLVRSTLGLARVPSALHLDSPNWVWGRVNLAAGDLFIASVYMPSHSRRGDQWRAAFNRLAMAVRTVHSTFMHSCGMLLVGDWNASMTAVHERCSAHALPLVLLPLPGDLPTYRNGHSGSSSRIDFALGSAQVGSVLAPWAVLRSATRVSRTHFPILAAVRPVLSGPRADNGVECAVSGRHLLAQPLRFAQHNAFSMFIEGAFAPGASTASLHADFCNTVKVAAHALGATYTPGYDTPRVPREVRTSRDVSRSARRTLLRAHLSSVGPGLPPPSQTPAATADAAHVLELSGSDTVAFARVPPATLRAVVAAVESRDLRAVWDGLKSTLDGARTNVFDVLRLPGTGDRVVNGVHRARRGIASALRDAYAARFTDPGPTFINDDDLPARDRASLEQQRFDKQHRKQ